MQFSLEHIKRALEQPLPGEIAQLKMAPLTENETTRTIPPPPPGVRKSGVLLLLSAEQNRLEFTLTLRSSRLLSHSGQLSLPGGRIEKGESPEQAALRETHEEIGISQHHPEILGRLSALHVPHSGNLIYPIVGWIDRLPPLTLEPFEVAEAFQVGVDVLFDEHKTRTETWTLRGESYTVPMWQVHPEVPLWGATAMILSEFKAVLEGLSPT